MVKGYDPTVNDPSRIALEYLLRWSTTPNSLTMQQAERYAKHWLKNSSSTSQIYNKFSTFNTQNARKPQIVLRKKCSKILDWSYWKMLFNKQNPTDQHYPAFTQDNKIVVCVNLITNKTQLKENIDRELTILLKQQQKRALSQANKLSQSHTLQTSKEIQNQIQEKDKQLMQFLYQGCKQGYRNYMLEKQVEERISKKCAKYLFFRRCQRQLPWDAKFRYATKIIEEVV